jgi:signal transduction histidine kinase
MKTTHRRLVSKLELNNEGLASNGEALAAMNEELQATNNQLLESQGQLEQTVRTLGERTRWLALLHDVSLAIGEASTWDDALQRVLRSICEAEQWQAGYVYLPDPQNGEVILPVVSWLASERLRPFHDFCEQQRYSRGLSLPGRIFASGIPEWIADQSMLLRMMPLRAAIARDMSIVSAVALPIVFGRQTRAVLELVSDREHAASPDLLTLMNDVGAQIGRILDRERAAAEVADYIWSEQQALLHTLHDSLGQTLTGIGMLSAGLAKRLSGVDALAVETASHIATQTQAALEEVRQLSHGLFPIEIEGNSLLSALRRLASTTAVIHGIRVDVESDVEVPVRDVRIVTQLYRIAQEAVTNAVRHARPGSIILRLSTAGAVSKLQVIDDGIGVEAALPLTSGGLGLQIMRHRAASIGASFSIARRTEGGTIVRCTVREAPRPSGR